MSMPCFRRWAISAAGRPTSGRTPRIVRTGLDAQIAAAPGAIELIAGERRQLLERHRSRVAQAEALVEDPGPQPDGQRQRIVRAHQLLRARRPLGEEIARITVGDVESGEDEVIEQGRGDPGLVSAEDRGRREVRAVRLPRPAVIDWHPARHRLHARAVKIGWWWPPRSAPASRTEPMSRSSTSPCRATA